MSKTSALNILFLASWYPSKVHATLGNFVQRHAQAIATKHNVTLVYLAKDIHLKSPFQIEVESVNDVKEIICYYRDKGILGSGYLKAFNHVLKNELKPDIELFNIVHVNVLFKAGYLAKRLKELYQIPYIITEHWTGYHNGKEVGWIQKLLSKKIAQNATQIVPVSEHLATAMKNFGLHTSYSVVPNVVDHELFQPTKEKNDTYTFIHVSSLVDDHKNVSGILRAFHSIYQTLNIRLEIVGDGDITPYQDLSNQLGIPSDKISFTGAQPLTSIAQRMAAAHCLILFSNYENQPCVIPEAHSTGIPVIATDVGGIKEHLSPQHGILIKKQDETALTEAMKTIYKNRETYDSAWLRSYAIDHFSVQAIAEAYTRVYLKSI